MMTNQRAQMPEHDVFEKQSSISDGLVEEYYTRSSRKSADEKWLKENRPAILAEMAAQSRDKKDFGLFRVKVSTPDESNFDKVKVYDYLQRNGHQGLFKLVVDEEALAAAIEEGTLDLDELKAEAWITKTGSPRLKVEALK